jgi:hypothetical protein
MYIKKFKKFIESISGTELMNVGGVFGPGYGEQSLPVTLSQSDTEVVLSELTDDLYTKDDYDNLYDDYLKKGGEHLDGFNKINLDKVIYYLKNAI